MMADKGYSFLTMIIAAILLVAFSSPVRGQEPAEKQKTDKAPAPQAAIGLPTQPQLPDVETPDKKDKDKDKEDGSAAYGLYPDYTKPEAELESDRAARRRVKPEHPFYFTAQYTESYDDNIVFGDTERRSDVVSRPEFGFGYQHVTPRSMMRVT